MQSLPIRCSRPYPIRSVYGPFELYLRKLALFVIVTTASSTPRINVTELHPDVLRDSGPRLGREWYSCSLSVLCILCVLRCAREQGALSPREWALLASF
ncbi:hypothetical protein GY45DRAFT_499175 [Cubamyces sp. BRFM 1775]|nr:hypothetical protein GY45DRAFT_499175 [Cubamyces sp. BRFM 1775]